MTGVELIAQERQRQVEEEGWTPEHDAGHRPGHLSAAAASYLDAGVEQIFHPWVETNKLDTRTDWPWDGEWWKPSDDPIRNLVKAGALIAAEIDRLRVGAR